MMIEHSTEYIIEEGFTKSIVDSREREKEFKQNQALGIHTRNVTVKKEKMIFNVTPKIENEIKNYVENLGYKSESAFCNEAINEYLAKLHYNNIGDYINKMWLATVGRKRIEEIIDPELAIDRALETYQKKGYSEEWIH